MSTVKWTSQKPTKKGLYWYVEIENEGGVSLPIIGEVRKCPYSKDLCVYYFGHEIGDDLQDLDGFWSTEPIGIPPFELTKDLRPEYE